MCTHLCGERQSWLTRARGVVRGAALLILWLAMAVSARAQQGHEAFARGHILVKFRDTALIGECAAALEQVRARGVVRLGNLPVHAVFVNRPGDEEAAVAALRARPEVEFAEMDARVKIAAVPNDPKYPSQWHLPKVSAPSAWDFTTGSPSLIVAILDTGCDPTHPDLMPNYVPGWNFYDNNSNTADVHGHGTMVAGCVGAAGNNAQGVASVSWATKIMPCRVADPTGYAYYSTIASALQWAADHGARIANISFSGVAGSASILSGAQYMYNKGGITVCAAGNDGTNPGYSASTYRVDVSATDSSDLKASWSNYGAYITVAAPGVNVYTTTRGGGYGAGSGTSFAAPVCCGVLALAWSANPRMTNAQLVQVLKGSATDLGAAGWDSYYGWGRVNAYEAVLDAQSIAVDTTAPSASITSPAAGSVLQGTVTVQVAASDNVGVTKVELYVDGAFHSALTTAPYNFSWNTLSVANGNHTLSAKAYDAAGNVGTASSVTVSVSNAVDTTPPTCAITNPPNGSTVGRVVSVSVTASDNVGVTKVELYLDNQLVGSSTASSASFNLNTKKWSTGAHMLKASAYDARGNRGDSAVVTVYK